MKLVTFDAGAGMRPGVVAESAGVGHEVAPILDLPAAFAFLEARSGRASDPASVAARYGAEMLALIECQAAALPAIAELLELHGRGLIPDSDGKRPLLHPRKGVQLLAPIPRPLSMRDGYAFRQHVEAARRNRGLPMIPEFDEIPIFYYTNHLSVIGPGPVRVRPLHLQQLDFELEAAVVLGRTVRNADVAAAPAGLPVASVASVASTASGTAHAPSMAKVLCASCGTWACRPVKFSSRDSRMVSTGAFSASRQGALSRPVSNPTPTVQHASSTPSVKVKSTPSVPLSGKSAVTMGIATKP